MRPEKPAKGTRRRANARPGVVVCVCEKDGKISTYDPGAWRRRMVERRNSKGNSQGGKQRERD